MPYALNIHSVGSDYATLGFSFDAAFLNDWLLGLEYRTAFGSGRQDYPIVLKIGARFWEKSPGRRQKEVRICPSAF
ncbi:hypothetical protein QEZ48_00525 [Aquamicrobium lusatiense]|uniref:hypothetical protein n=1 Tax=Aquamicrobium lusatiense TaxID=89772 RepID=UPI002454A4DE|nr:hypothetical protein [Aquamicrobium lusatiense]MDH4989320.1 hypothetical protein [Aquamicrobium lusatiense]